MIIQHNIQAMNGNRMLGRSTQKLRKSTEKLSSGYRINRAGDDAAGLAISEKMRGQIRGLDRGTENVEDGISLIQTADGAMAEIHDMVHRMRELSVQAANDTNTTEDREDIQEEINQLSKEITRISDTTEYNTMKILKGDTIEVAKSKTGSLTELRQLYKDVSKTTYRLETGYFEDIEIPGYEKYTSLPDWIMGTNPLYPTTQTTTTGAVGEVADFGEIRYYAMYKGFGSYAGSSFSKNISPTEYNTQIISGVTKVELKNLVNTADGRVDESNTIIDVSYANGATAEKKLTDFASLFPLLSSYQRDMGKQNLLNNQTLTIDAHKEKVTHASAKIDFSNLNSKNIFDLVEGEESHGFHATCDACTNFYNISFVEGTSTRAFEATDKIIVNGTERDTPSLVFEIGIGSLLEKAKKGGDVTGKELIELTINALKSIPSNQIPQRFGAQVSNLMLSYNPTETVFGAKFHHQAIAKDPTNENIMLFMDTCTYLGENQIKSNNKWGGSIFGVTVKDGKDPTHKQVPKKKPVSLDLLQDGVTPDDKTYTMYYTGEERDFFRIQAGANGGQEITIRLPDISLEKMQIKDLNVLDHANAAVSIDRCKAAINYLNSERSRMGAYQNRMEHTVLSNENTSENLQASESRICDADMASEMAEYSKYNILQQAGQSVLAQANQITQGVLSLLQ